MRSVFKIGAPLVAAALALTACGGTTGDSGSGSGSKACDLKIGFFGALTGDAANLGINIKNGAELGIVELNCASTVHLAKRVVQAMVARGEGRMLFTSSIASQAPEPFQAVYAASKAFVQSFALALRESTRSWRDLPLRLVPAALLAAGSVYVYSFPGLIWLGGTALLWALL